MMEIERLKALQVESDRKLVRKQANLQGGKIIVA